MDPSNASEYQRYDAHKSAPIVTLLKDMPPPVQLISPTSHPIIEMVTSLVDAGADIWYIDCYLYNAAGNTLWPTEGASPYTLVPDSHRLKKHKHNHISPIPTIRVKVDRSSQPIGIAALLTLGGRPGRKDMNIICTKLVTTVKTMLAIDVSSARTVLAICRARIHALAAAYPDVADRGYVTDPIIWPSSHTSTTDPTSSSHTSSGISIRPPSTDPSTDPSTPSDPPTSPTSDPTLDYIRSLEHKLELLSTRVDYLSDAAEGRIDANKEAMMTLATRVNALSLGVDMRLATMAETVEELSRSVSAKDGVITQLQHNTDHVIVELRKNMVELSEFVAAYVGVDMDAK